MAMGLADAGNVNLSTQKCMSRAFEAELEASRGRRYGDPWVPDHRLGLMTGAAAGFAPPLGESHWLMMDED